MTVDEAIAQVLKYHGCGHPVMKAAGVLRLEVERLRKSDAFHTEACGAHQRHIDELKQTAERRAEGRERCEECRQWFDAEQCVLTVDGCYLCAACADSLREDEPYTSSPGGPQ